MTTDNIYRPHQSRIELTPRQKLGAVLAGTLALGGTVVGVLHKIDQQPQNSFKKTEQEVLNRMNSHEGNTKNEAWDVVVVLGEDAKLRSAPVSTGEGKGALSTVVGKVEKGEVLRIDRPRTFTDHKGDMWVSFHQSSKGEDRHTATDGSQILWANFSELQRQNENGHALALSYAYPDSVGGMDIPLDVDQNGNLVAVEPLTGPNQRLSTGSSLPADVFLQMVDQEGLILQHK